MEALAFYHSIQPAEAKANPSADETIVAYLTGEPSAIMAAYHDAALDVLNGVASALLLTQYDLVTSYQGPDNALDQRYENVVSQAQHE